MITEDFILQKYEVEYIDINKLKPYEKNPRKISDQEMQKLKRSINEFGFVDPVIVRRKDKVIISGHQRIEAAKELEIKTVPVIFITIDDQRISLLNMALNKISGDWDNDKLSDLFNELKPLDIDLELSGFDMSEIDRMLSNMDYDDDDKEVNIPDEQYIVYVTCEDENEQQTLFEKLKKEGYFVRLSTM